MRPGDGVRSRSATAVAASAGATAASQASAASAPGGRPVSCSVAHGLHRLPPGSAPFSAWGWGFIYSRLPFPVRAVPTPLPTGKPRPAAPLRRMRLLAVGQGLPAAQPRSRAAAPGSPRTSDRPPSRCSRVSLFPPHADACVVEDEYGLHDRGDSVGTAAELPKEPSALQDRRGLLDQEADLGATTVVSALPLLPVTASERDVNAVAGSLVRLARMAFIVSVRVWGESGQHVDCLAYAAMDRRDADAETGGELGIVARCSSQRVRMQVQPTVKTTLPRARRPRRSAMASAVRAQSRIEPISGCSRPEATRRTRAARSWP